jgi:hypothetical protein
MLTLVIFSSSTVCTERSCIFATVDMTSSEPEEVVVCVLVSSAHNGSKVLFAVILSIHTYTCQENIQKLLSFLTIFPQLAIDYLSLPLALSSPPHRCLNLVNSSLLPLSSLDLSYLLLPSSVLSSLSLTHLSLPPLSSHTSPFSKKSSWSFRAASPPRALIMVFKSSMSQLLHRTYGRERERK